MDKALPKTKATERIASIVPVVKLNVNSIIPNPNQPRTYFDPTKLSLLAETIKIRGDVENPVQVSPHDDELYMLTDGERRWRGAKMAGIEYISAIIKPCLSDNERHEISALLNFCTQDMSYLEKGEALARIMRDKGINQTQLSKVVGLTQPEISNYLRALNLHPDIKKLWRERKITNVIAMNLAFHRIEHQLDILDSLTELLSRKGRGKIRRDAIGIARIVRRIAEEKGYVHRRKRKGTMRSSAEITGRAFEKALDVFLSELLKVCDLERSNLLQLRDPSARNILDFIEIAQGRLSRAENIITEKIE